MDRISEAFRPGRKLKGGGSSMKPEGMAWGKEGLGAWVTYLSDEVLPYKIPYNV